MKSNSEKFFKIGLARPPKGAEYIFTTSGAILLNYEGQPKANSSMVAWLQGAQLVREFENTRKQYDYFIDSAGDVSRKKKDYVEG